MMTVMLMMMMIEMMTRRWRKLCKKNCVLVKASLRWVQKTLLLQVLHQISSMARVDCER